ncbi:DNA helicase, putative [uncultured Candidatus Thioglobus sp.]|nr:DNA helicase, putative [uncultured Candidatus Thioglobus sp.]
MHYRSNKKTNPNKDRQYRCELPNNVECELLEGSRQVKHYNDAMEHRKIWHEVAQKQNWKPYESSNIEERKWNSYLELYKKIIDDQKVSASIEDIKIDSEKDLRAKLSGELEEEQIEKIRNAKGEDVSFSITNESKKLGKITFANDESIAIKLDKDFKKSLKDLINNGRFLLKDQDEFSQIQCNYSIEPLSKDTENYIFYSINEKPVFQAKFRYKVNEVKDSDDKVTLVEDKEKVEIDEVNLLRLNISVDFISESYQINVMRNSFGKVKKMALWQVLSGERVAKLPNPIKVDFDKNSRLNEEQKKAVEGALGTPELFLIWGPPGTGKTEVIQEIAKQEALMGNKTLISSQSNLAVDNALARLSDLSGVYPFRIAKKDYKLEGEDNEKVPFLDTSGLFFIKNLQKTLNAKIDNSASNESILDLQKQFFKQLERAKKTYKKERKSDCELREFKQHSELYRKNINVVGATLMETGRKERQNGKNKLCNTTNIKEFDTVIIDEVSKATPTELFIPIALGKKLILVGDHKQLPPMFKMLSNDDRTQEEWAEKANIDENELDIDSTIFERLWDRHIEDALPVRAMLTKQYRMHPKIQSLIEPFYTDSEGKLSFGFGKNNQTAIDDLTLKNIDFCKSRPIMWIRTKEKVLETNHNPSFSNEDEIANVGKLLKVLSKANDKQLSVGVITFYGAQLRELRNQYYEKYKRKFGDGKLIFGTVDRFQGRECDVIICSLVRNNEHRNIGFASKINRINVAFSRARKSLIILGSSKQFCYEGKNKTAQSIYKVIYDKCDKPKPKELD